MGLVMLPGCNSISNMCIQYFSFSEEVQAIGIKFFSFIFTISTPWIILITFISLCFIAGGLFYRFAHEVEDLNQ